MSLVINGRFPLDTHACMCSMNDLIVKVVRRGWRWWDGKSNTNQIPISSSIIPRLSSALICTRAKASKLIPQFNLKTSSELRYRPHEGHKNDYGHASPGPESLCHIHDTNAGIIYRAPSIPLKPADWDPLTGEYWRWHTGGSMLASACGNYFLIWMKKSGIASLFSIKLMRAAVCAWYLAISSQEFLFLYR